MQKENAAAALADDKSVMDVFVVGAKKGWDVGINNIVPNVLMAYVCIQILKITGALALCGKLFAPVMAVFGLPGEGIMVILSALMSMGGAVGVAASLYNEGVLEMRHVTIVIPAIYLLGSKIQYLGRLLGTAGVKAKYYPVLIGISVVNAMIAMIIMRFFA